MKTATGKGRGPSFIRTTLLYGLGDVLTKGARIVLLPYYVAVLSMQELGELAVYVVVATASWTLCSFGLPNAIQRQYVEYGEAGNSYVSTVWLTRLLGGLPVLGVLLAVVWGYQQLEYTRTSLGLMLIAVCNGYLRSGVSLVEAWFMARQEPVAYRSYTFLQFLTNTALIIVFVSFLGWGVAGVVWAELLAYLAWTLLSSFLLFRRSLPDFQIVRWSSLISYAMPGIPHAFFMWGLSGSDRLILQHSQPLEQIAVYDVSYQLASFLSIVTLSLRAAWLPRYFKQVSCNIDNKHQGYGHATTMFLSIILTVALAGLMLAPELFSWLPMQVDASSSVRIFRIVLLGIVAMGMFVFVNQPALSEHRVGVVALVSGAGLAVNLLCNLTLIPITGIDGAALSTVFAYSFMAVTMFVFTLRSYSIDWPWPTLIGQLGVFAFFALAAFLIEDRAWTWSLWLRILGLGLAGVAALATLRPLLGSMSKNLVGSVGNRKLPASSEL